MSRQIGVRCLFGLAAAAGLGLAGAACGEPPPRAPLDALWEQHMLERKSVAIAIEDSRAVASEKHSTESFEFAQGRPEAATWTSHGISVRRLDEGFWRNGGWALEGGLLGRVADGASTFELYGKAVVRRYAYVPFPFHRSIPHETGYEFFLLHRRQGVPGATIGRQWVFRPDEVVVERRPGGGSLEEVRGLLRYDASTHTATVRITGLKQSFEERVDLSSDLGSSGR